MMQHQLSGAAGGVLFSAHLEPNCSLGRGGFLLLMAAAAAVGFAVGLVFLLLGAWPVAGLVGIEYLLLLFAFRISYRRARQREHLELTFRDLTVRRIDPCGREGRWSFQPYWLRVELAEPGRSESPLLLSSHGRSLAIGAFLAPEERAQLAEALQRALAPLKGGALPLPSRPA